MILIRVSVVPQKILITNDDGCESLAIRKLAQVLSDYAEVMVLCPDREQSGVSQAFTYSRPLKLKKLEDWACEAYSLSGTPADCVKFALCQLWTDVDFVVSGVNNGLNLGIAALYSGTVAAAREALLWNRPALALSAPDFSPEQQKIWEAWIRAFFVEKKYENMDAESLWNVNFPVFKGVDPQIKFCEMGMSMYEDKYTPIKDGEWILEGVKNPEYFESESDDYWHHNGYISICPLGVPQTNFEALKRLKAI
jgi:5'-nucleotidase